MINTELPCYGPNKDRLILSENEIAFLQIDVEKELPIEQCPGYPWRRNTENRDRRYSEIGFTTLKALQEDNGVYDTLFTEMRHYHSFDREFWKQIRG